jgi:hypothetical protein
MIRRNMRFFFKGAATSDGTQIQTSTIAPNWRSFGPFPSDAVEYDSTAGLRQSVRSFVHRNADLSESFEEIASYYVLMSWIYDAFTEVPYRRLKGDYGSGKTRALQTIGSICYKPMFVSGASTVSPFFRIIDSFRGTLVLDESDFRFSDERAEITKILDYGNATGFPVLRSESTPTKEFNPRAFAVFGPKIIATRRDFEPRFSRRWSAG